MMVKRSVTLIAGLLFLLPFVVSVMVSPSQAEQQPTRIQEPTVTVGETVRLAMQVTAAIAVTPTIPVVPTATSTPERAIEIFYYSYYYPDLLAPLDIVNGVCANQEGDRCHTVNCWEYNILDGRCESAMATGLDWHDYIGQAVACGFEYPLGTTFRVLEPKSIVGIYTCLDRCPACTGKKQLDFLSLTQELPWNQELMVQVNY